MTKEIAVDEWLAELERIEEESADGVTVAELIAESGHSNRWWHVRLKAGVAAGKVEVVTVKRQNLLGRMVQVPGYRLVGERQ